MKEIFEIVEDKETRIWNKYMSNTYELLARKDQTIQDCGLYNGQVRILIILAELSLITFYLFGKELKTFVSHNFAVIFVLKVCVRLVDTIEKHTVLFET